MNGFHEDLPQEFFALFHSVKSPLAAVHRLGGETNEILEEITGEKISFVRPPYGSWDKSFEKELNMFPVLWNIDPLDWCSHNADCIASKVVEKAGDGDIILMHDYYETSVTAALEVVDILQKRGFQFVTVEEILFD